MTTINMVNEHGVWRAGHRARMGGFGDLDVQATVAQMDTAVAQLRGAWNSINSGFSIQWTGQLADAEDARLASLKGLIDDLDVGGVARIHVFNPIDGQTQEDAWQTWQDTADYVRQGLNAVGGTISKWSFTNVAAQVGGQVGGDLKSVGTWVVIAVGGLVALQLLQMFRGRSMAGYGALPAGRKRRRKRRRK